MTDVEDDLRRRTRRLHEAGLTSTKPPRYEEVPPREATYVVRFDELSCPELFAAFPDERVTKLRPEVAAGIEAADPRVEVAYDHGDVGESWADVTATFRDRDAALAFRDVCDRALKVLTAEQVERTEAWARGKGIALPDLPGPGTPTP